MSEPPPLTVSQIFSGAYPGIAFKEACKLPKYTKAVAWARKEYNAQFESEEEEEEPLKSVKDRPPTPPPSTWIAPVVELREPEPPPPDVSIWQHPEFKEVASRVESLEALLEDLSQRERRLSEFAREHEEQLRTANLLLGDTKKNIELLLVQLDRRKRGRMTEIQ